MSDSCAVFPLYNFSSPRCRIYPLIYLLVEDFLTAKKYTKTIEEYCFTHSLACESKQVLRKRIEEKGNLTMSIEQHKAIVRSMFEGINQGNLAVLDDYLAADFVTHAVPRGMPANGESHKRAVQLLHTAFPDYHVTVEDMIAEGDKVMARLTVEGTHRGDFFGIPPTGKHVTWAAVDIFRFADDKWVEYWLSTDSLGLLQQLRASPIGDN
jgi:steroid delta-isomerase-like uncharacterized protein